LAALGWAIFTIGFADTGAMEDAVSLVMPNGSNGDHVIHDELNQDIQAKSHAAEKHSADAVAVRQCLDDYGSMHIFFNPNSKRYANICFMPDGKYGIRIVEEVNGKMQEVTAFVKEKLKTWQQMGRYLENGGYTNMIK
jgi:hypothetical protein